MRTRNYFKYLLAAIVAIGTSVNVMADEATYKFNYESQTVELQTIKAPYGTSVTLNAPFKRASKTLFSWLNDNYKDRVYLDNNAEGSIDFTGFRYEVTAVTMYVMANPNISGNNLYTDVKNFYNDETAKQSNTFRIGFSQGNGLTFRENNFLDKNISTINGLGQLYLKGLSNNNHAFFRGANDASPTFKITYNRPVVSTRFVSGSNGSEIEGYISDHAGAFLENGQLAGGAYFKYTSDNIDILEFKNSKSGKMTFHKGGNASIRVSLIYGNKTIAHYDQTIYLSTVTLDHNDGTGAKEQIVMQKDQPMPTIETPTRPGYDFYGYYADQSGYNYSWLNGGTEYYNKNGLSVKSWDRTGDVTLYAHWKEAKYIVTFDGTEKSIVPDQMGYSSWDEVSKLEDFSKSDIKISFTYGMQCGTYIYNGRFKKAGFKMVGIYDENGELVASVDIDNPTNRNIYFEENSKYWKRLNGQLVWNYPHNVTFTARYVPKYTLEDGNIINFGTSSLEVGKDWEDGKVHDLLGAVETEVEAGTISRDNPVTVFDLRTVKYERGDSKDGAILVGPLINNDFVSPNLLFYLGEGIENVQENMITIDNTCNSLVVTDRIPMKIPYAFTAKNAIYERNKAFINDDNDAMWQQSKDSKWGTLCLPYPITNNQKYDKNGVKYTIRFYELHNTYGNGQGQEYMQFYEMKDADQVIAANTPVLYCRTEGSAGSDITVKATNVEVHANAGYGTNLVDYKEKVDRKEAEESVMYWKFVGTLQTKEYCGAEYNGRVADGVYQNIENKMGATFIDHNKMEIYFFESDKFKKLSRKGKIILYPYRAFFEDHTITYLEQSGESKVSSYSILVVDADGTTTDITNLVGNNNAKGDGKIYDLSGRRVKQPVKGSIYIVDGKKKMY